MKKQFIFIALSCVWIIAAARSKYVTEEEDNPYEFGFTIDGQQHRHEKKDANGIIQGEFGFITADGIYHVTVYATDENGNFKILSMRNVRVSGRLDEPNAALPDTSQFSKGQPAAPNPLSIESTPAPVQTVQPVTQSNRFTTQSTIKPACAGCGYVTHATPLNKPDNNLPFQTQAGFNPKPQNVIIGGKKPNVQQQNLGQSGIQSGVTPGGVSGSGFGIPPGTKAPFVSKPLGGQPQSAPGPNAVGQFNPPSNNPSYPNKGNQIPLVPSTQHHSAPGANAGSHFNSPGSPNYPNQGNDEFRTPQISIHEQKLQTTSQTPVEHPQYHEPTQLGVSNLGVTGITENNHEQNIPALPNTTPQPTLQNSVSSTGSYEAPGQSHKFETNPQTNIHVRPQEINRNQPRVVQFEIPVHGIEEQSPTLAIRNSPESNRQIPNTPDIIHNSEGASPSQNQRIQPVLQNQPYQQQTVDGQKSVSLEPHSKLDQFVEPHSNIKPVAQTVDYTSFSGNQQPESPYSVPHQHQTNFNSVGTSRATPNPLQSVTHKFKSHESQSSSPEQDQFPQQPYVTSNISPDQPQKFQKPFPQGHQEAFPQSQQEPSPQSHQENADQFDQHNINPISQTQRYDSNPTYGDQTKNQTISPYQRPKNLNHVDTSSPNQNPRPVSFVPDQSQGQEQFPQPPSSVPQQINTKPLLQVTPSNQNRQHNPQLQPHLPNTQQQQNHEVPNYNLQQAPEPRTPLQTKQTPQPDLRQTDTPSYKQEQNIPQNTGFILSHGSDNENPQISGNHQLPNQHQQDPLLNPLSINPPNHSTPSQNGITVSNGVINIPNNSPIPIQDKYPGMVDGLPAGIKEGDITDLLYRFNYTVGFHGHYEKGYKNGAKVGGYFVNDRDGVSRIVTYVADENGYRPKVKFVRLDLTSDLVPKEGSEKTFGLKNFEFVWYPLN